jgi:polysaccharide export outer membrane protein
MQTTSEGSNMRFKSTIAAALTFMVCLQVFPQTAPGSDWKRFYILGEVHQPMRIALNRQITLMQAAAMAGGFLRQADQSKIMIIRRDSQSGEQTPIYINAQDILSGKTKDVEMLPDDVIYVPNKREAHIKSGGCKF